MFIYPAKYLRGEIRLPGDKSISHRAAIVASMAEGVTEIRNFAASADCGSTLSCLDALGVEITQDGSKVTISGVGKSGFSRPDGPLDCGNSGTTMRLLAGVLAGQGFESILTGDESLQRRPMKRIIEPLESMGADVEAAGGHAPLHITGNKRLRAIDFEPQIASAQIKSCVLLAGLNAEGETSVIEPVETRDHTERMLRWFGADVSETKYGDGKKLTVSGEAILAAADLHVPADVSAAAFFIVAAACLPNSEILLRNIGLNPSRKAILDVLRYFGASIEIANQREECNEPLGDLTVKGGGLSLAEPGTNILDGPVIANLIDEIPILAVFGSQLENGLEIRGATELRVKESDRISSVVENLRRMNAAIDEFPDGFRVARSDLKGAMVDSFGDHRIAMAFAVAGLLASGETEIIGEDCAAVSFPGFFEILGEAVN